jgi:plasmid rolling circle replication initiator protein Rep
MTKLEKHSYFLDTLVLTSDYNSKKSLETQYYKALRKYKTNQKVISIIDTLQSAEQKKKYWRTWHCNEVILQNGSVFRGSLCRKMWCTHCNRIKAYELTEAYKEPLRSLGQLYFVTLTRPNVKGRQLKSEVQKLIKAFQKIKDNLRKNYKVKLCGMRKLEVTYNEETDTYHPHFHFIQSNLHHSELLQELWLKQFTNASIKAQDISYVDAENEKSFIELFKYATKETTKEGKQYTGEVLHTIYSALEGQRKIQTYGSIKKVKAPKEAKDETNNFSWIEPNEEIWIYDNEQKDWLTASNEKLINTLEIEKNIKSYGTNQRSKEQKSEANNQKCRSLYQVDTARKGANEKSIRGSRNEHIGIRLK